MSDLDGSAVASLRRLNGSKVLSVLRTEAYRKFTVREMSIATGLSRPTVGRLLDDLVEAGWALDIEGQPGATGRPARRYWFNRFAGVIVSLDVGPNGAAIMITDLVGSELSWGLEIGHHFETVESVLEYVFPVLDERLAAVRSEYQLGEDELPILALSLAAPVIPDADGTHVDTLAVAASWLGGNFVPALRERFGDIPILVNNDVVLAAEAEVHLGALALSRQGIYCLLSAVCVIVLVREGKVHLGAHHLAGDIGELPEYRWKDAIARAREAAGPCLAHSAQAVVDAAMDGNETATRAIAGLGEDLSRGLRDIAAVWDPDTIVFAGQFPPVGDAFMRPIETMLRDLGGDDFDLRPTEISEDKGTAIGGTLKALDAIDWTV